MRLIAKSTGTAIALLAVKIIFVYTLSLLARQTTQRFILGFSAAAAFYTYYIQAILPLFAQQYPAVQSLHTLLAATPYPTIILSTITGIITAKT